MSGKPIVNRFCCELRPTTRKDIWRFSHKHGLAMMGRNQRHFVLAASTVLFFAVAAGSGSASSIADRLSIVSAYVCLALLGYALLIGPAQAMATGRPIVNTYIRRDVGIWAAFCGLVHFVLANILSMNDAYLDHFVNLAETPPATEFRSQLYTWGTIFGYIVAVLFLLLLGLSSDRVFRVIGPRWWKRLQRAIYLVFVFTVAHAFAFQILESRQGLLISIVVFISLLIPAGQVFGIAAVRKRALSLTARQ